MRKNLKQIWQPNMRQLENISAPKHNLSPKQVEETAYICLFQQCLAELIFWNLQHYKVDQNSKHKQGALIRKAKLESYWHLPR